MAERFDLGEPEVTTDHPDFPPSDKFRFEWERLVRRCMIPGPVKLVGYTLAQYGNAWGTEIRPGFPRLASTCGMGESTARRHVDTLLGVGLVVRLTHGGGRTRKAATYRLAVPIDLVEKVPMLAPDETTPLPYSAHVRSGVAADYSAQSAENSAQPGEPSSYGYSAQSELLLRSSGLSTPLAAVSAHQGTHQPHTHQGNRSPQVSTSPGRSAADAKPDISLDPETERRRQLADLAARFPGFEMPTPATTEAS